MNIGINIRSLRKKQGLTQRQLANSLAVSEQAVSKWENNTCAPDIAFLPKLAEIFDVSIDFILTGEENIKYIEISKFDLCETNKTIIHQTIGSQQDTYNGIKLPKFFPPKNMDKIKDYDKLPVPYLKNKPKVIDITVGRQLFVDEFLIETTSFVREYHKPIKYHGNPVFYPETELEKGLNGHVSMAAPFSDGVWYDGQDKRFKMWYHAGWFDGTAYAESMDGINWKRINSKNGDNRVIPVREGIMRDSCAVVVDNYHKNTKNKYKMFLYSRPVGGEVYESVDGVNWELICNTGQLGDRSTIFYNPFRDKWVFSIRSDFGTSYPLRARMYKEADSLAEGADLNDSVYWARADRYDTTDFTIGNIPTLYNLDAIAYESIMLGAFCLFLGPENDESTKIGIPKNTKLHMAYSRDGFHWYRSQDRTAFIECERNNPQSWERGYIQSNNAVCIINGDSLLFYYTAFQGDAAKINNPVQADGIYANASMGIAQLRRDGFASMNSYGFKGYLTTRLMNFSGEYLFVNGDFRGGALKVSVLDENGQSIEGFDSDDCIKMCVDSTKHMIVWDNNNSLAKLKDRNIKLKFEGSNGSLYAFWISDTQEGKSRGYLAGGEIGKSLYIDR